MLEANQIVIVGLIASVIVWLIKWAMEKNKPIPSAVLTILVYAVSLVLAVFWIGVKVPPYTGDIAAYVQTILAWLGGYVAFAILIYQAFVKYLLEHGIPMLWRKGTKLLQAFADR